MKRILSSLILLIAFNYGFSQQTHYGIGAGLNYSTMLLDNPLMGEYGYKAGFQVNAIIDHGFNDQLSLQIEPGVTNRGTISKQVYQPEYNVNITYLNLPILLRYSLFKQFSVLLGPEASIKLAAKASNGGNSVDANILYDRAYDFGIHAGLSYRLTDRLDLDLRYYRGFVSTVSVYTITNGQGVNTATLHFQSFSALLSYRIK